ncbi:MAG: 6,7-dimethyl-8-ribityllumazine synthase [Paracoccaceae bacterium]
MASSEEHGVLPLPEFNTPRPSVLIVAAPFYRQIADDLITGAQAELDKAGAAHEVIEVPGALEIPTAIRLAAKSFEGFVALGCVVRGETTHYETVCNDSSRGLALLGIEGLCIGNGILTCESMGQARVRAAPAEMNKGGGAAAAALHLIALARRFRVPAPPPSSLMPDETILLAGTGLPGRTA